MLHLHYRKPHQVKFDFPYTNIIHQMLIICRSLNIIIMIAEFI
jgi:hypothetical protein